MPLLISKESLLYFGKIVLLGFVYAGVAYVSLYLVPPNGGGALVWPPAALGLAILFLFGLELWPGMMLGFFVLLLFDGQNPPVAAMVALANTLEAVLGAYLLQRLGFHPLMSRLRDTLSLIVVAFVTTAAGASIIVMSVYFFLNPAGATPTLWSNLWVGHAVSILSFGAFFIRWLHRPRFVKTSREVIEGVAVFGSLATLTFLAFWTPYTSFSGVSLVYLALIPLIVSTLRAGPRGITLCLALIAGISATGTLFGYGLAAQSVTTHTLFVLQVLVGALSIIFLLFTSIVEERKEAERVLKEYIGKLEDALEKIRGEDQAKSDFLAILAHELRNPLSPILSSLEIMKQNGIWEVNRKPVETIVEHVHTMARLLDDLLDISRISQKKFRLQKEPAELQSVVRHALATTEAYFTSQRHTLHVEMPQEPLWLLADPTRLRQALVNLLNNAAKYTDPGGTVFLRATREGEDIVVGVKDTGIGIPPAKLRSIFEPIHKGEHAARRPGGLGIGLSLTKRLVELHDGTIEARSPGVGKGSEFIVRLPAPNRPLQLALPQELQSGRKKRGRFKDRTPIPISYRILIVDDNEAAANGMATLLAHGGHEVKVSYDGPEALEQVKSFAPHVVVLDIGLPTLDGYAVARIIRQNANGLENNPLLIALTGYGQEEDKLKAVEAGFEYHLVKPVSVVDIEGILLELRIDN